MNVQNLEFQQRTYSIILNLEIKIEQLTTSINNHMQTQGSNQLSLNLNVHKISVLSQRSGKTVEPTLYFVVVVKPEPLDVEQEQVMWNLALQAICL